MNQHRTKLLVLGVLVLGILAAALAFATGSRAASGNICKVDSGTPPTTPASCVTEIVGPHFITAGGAAVSVTKFHNEAGNGGSAATHLVLTVTFPAAVTSVVSETVFVAAPGTTTYKKISSACTVSLTLTSVSCPAGTVKGDGRAKMVVQFTGSGAGDLKGEATYGEGGGGTSNPPNDDQVNFDTLAVGEGGTAGGCFDVNGTQTVTGNGNGQQTQVTVPPTSDGTLPCTFVDAGVTAAKVGMLTQVSFVEFPNLSGNGYATVYIILNPIPTGFSLKQSPIYEDTGADGSFSTFITVPACDKKGNIVGPTGTPVVGQMDPSPVNDSCIFARTPLGKGSAGEIGLHVLANPFDQHFHG